jgi:hypothetical protein
MTLPPMAKQQEKKKKKRIIKRSRQRSGGLQAGEKRGGIDEARSSDV